ncbi:hypothetical protein GCM10007100_34450 [Roseibacillus persicicus]|uniref:Uncharacterized protein n=2 Tax=Roseibacillus persicicus TaxID=454148 RepID=A0A918TUF5_9BACT|nr:hypothetical protein GCM10007100_34450 [Roseibacillus persicicus]
MLSFGFLKANDDVPAGYVLQVMEPSGGKILRPKEWFYNEGHRESVWMWTISKEDTEKGTKSYDTGVRIQAILGLEEKTGKTPQKFIEEFVEQKKKSATEVHRTCEIVDQGLFSRICLETTEGGHRILYSMFWGNDLDIAVVSIAGAKKEEWDQYQKIFNRMSDFELIDMTRFTQKDGKDELEDVVPEKENEKVESGDK